MINPAMLIQQLMNSPQIMQNPIAQNVMRMHQSGDVNGLQRMAENICREKGISVDEISNRIKSQFGM